MYRNRVGPGVISLTSLSVRVREICHYFPKRKNHQNNNDDDEL
jgi:hypothetical protein